MTLAGGVTCPACGSGRTLPVGSQTIGVLVDSPGGYVVEHRVACPACGREYLLRTVCEVVRTELCDLHGTVVAVSGAGEVHGHDAKV